MVSRFRQWAISVFVACLLLTPLTARASNEIFSAGTGISITVTAGAASRVIANTGVTAIAGTANQVSLSASTGSVTVSLIGPYTPTTYTANGVLYGNTTSSIGATAAGTSGQVLVGGTSTPAFATIGCTGCSWTTGNNTLSLTATSGYISTTQVAGGACPYTVLSTDVFLLVSTTSATCAIIMPLTSGGNRAIFVKKQDANAFAVAVTKHTASSDTFDGTSGPVNVSIQYEEIGFVDYGSGTWAEL